MGAWERRSFSEVILGAVAVLAQVTSFLKNKWRVLGKQHKMSSTDPQQIQQEVHSALVRCVKEVERANRFSEDVWFNHCHVKDKTPAEFRCLCYGLSQRSPPKSWKLQSKGHQSVRKM